MQRHREKVTSLLKGTTAALRRVVADQKINASAPAALSDGVTAHNHRFIHAQVDLPDATTTAVYVLWVYYAMSELWSVHTTFAVVADTDGPTVFAPVEVDGVDRVFLQQTAGTGTFTVGANGWLGGSSF